LPLLPASSADTLSLRSQLTEIAKARRWARGHAEAAGFDEFDVDAVELALAEALSNVIRHGYQGDPTKRIDLLVEVDAERLCVCVRDYGPPFEPPALVPTDFEMPGPGGYGLRLIEELMDEVKRDTSSGKGTVLRLVKHRRRSER
jgi:serine/threonine-protein kinase RsbW